MTVAEMPWLARVLVNARGPRRARRVLAAIGPSVNPPPSGRILELGAGAGALSERLHERWPGAELVVSDFDPRLVSEIEASFARRFGSRPANVSVRALDARSIPFETGTFDVVFALLMLHHVETRHSEWKERPKALEEIRRVLAPGGLLVYQDFSRTEDLERTLGELGFTRVFVQRRWRRLLLAVHRAPGPGNAGHRA